MKELKIIIWVSWRSRSGRRAIDRILSEDVYTEGQRHNFREVAMKRVFLILSLLLPVTLLVSSASLAANKLDATIFSYDGKDFVRTETTLMQAGQSAVGTKLDYDSPAYKALVEKHSYTGPATVFGQNYQANYAPLIGGDGKLTGPTADKVAASYK